MSSSRYSQDLACTLGCKSNKNYRNNVNILIHIVTVLNWLISRHDHTAMTMSVTHLRKVRVNLR